MFLLRAEGEFCSAIALAARLSVYRSKGGTPEVWVTIRWAAAVCAAVCCGLLSVAVGRGAVVLQVAAELAGVVAGSVQPVAAPVTVS